EEKSEIIFKGESIPNDYSEISWWKRPAVSRNFWKFLIVFFITGQCFISWLSPLPQKFLNTPVNSALFVRNHINRPLKEYLGINRHPIFTDWAYENYNIVFKMEYEGRNGNKVIIPLFNEQGMPTSYNSGAIWCNTYTIAKSILVTKDLEKF